MYNTPIFYLR
jgi:hypothetical protein